MPRDSSPLDESKQIPTAASDATTPITWATLTDFSEVLPKINLYTLKALESAIHGTKTPVPSQIANPRKPKKQAPVKRRNANIHLI